MYSLTLKHHFDSAHRLTFHTGKCFNLHGHRWEVIVNIHTPNLDKNGMVVDFGRIKDAINHFDHKTILCNNEANAQLADILITSKQEVILLGCEPTAENLAAIIRNKIIDVCPSETIVKVTVFESPNSKVSSL